MPTPQTPQADPSAVLAKVREISEHLEAGTQGKWETAHATQLSGGLQNVTVFIEDNGDRRLVATFPVIKASNRMTWDAKFIAEAHNHFPSIASLCLEQAEEIKRLQNRMKMAISPLKNHKHLVRDECIEGCDLCETYAELFPTP